MIKGVLFDMDGVLVDSEEFICKAAIMMFSEYGINAAPEDFIPFVGMGENSYIGGVAAKYGLKADLNLIKARTYAVYEQIAKGNLFLLPGAKELLERCLRNGLRIALATSADKIKMEINMKETGIPLNMFYATVNGLDVERKKPFPEIYLKASELTGLKPEECLVVEDAISGIRAGKAAGCRCLAVTSTFNADAFHEADWVCKTLIEVPEEALAW